MRFYLYRETEPTSGAKDSDVDPEKEAAVGQVQRADNVAADGCWLVIFAIVDVGPPVHPAPLRTWAGRMLFSTSITCSPYSMRTVAVETLSL